MAAGLLCADISDGLLSGVLNKSGQESTTLIRVRRSFRHVVTSSLRKEKENLFFLICENMNLKDFPVITKIPVQWGEMDAAQHVNNVIYLRWSETGRIAYFKKLGYEVSPGGNEAGFILGWQDCKYIFPVTFPDTIYS